MNISLPHPTNSIVTFANRSVGGTLIRNEAYKVVGHPLEMLRRVPDNITMLSSIFQLLRHAWEDVYQWKDVPLALYEVKGRNARLYCVSLVDPSKRKVYTALEKGPIPFTVQLAWSLRGTSSVFRRISTHMSTCDKWLREFQMDFWQYVIEASLNQRALCR